MAAAAAVHLKGLAADGAVSDSNSVNSSASSVKRKRDPSDNGDQIMADAAAEAGHGSDVDSKESQSSGGSTRGATPAAVTTSTAGNRDEKRLIHDYFEVLSRYVRRRAMDPSCDFCHVAFCVVAC